MDNLGESDPLIKDALMKIVDREDFIKTSPVVEKNLSPDKPHALSDTQAQIGNDPTIVSELIKKNQTSLEELKQNIQTKSGAELFGFILEDLEELRRVVFEGMSVIIAAQDATTWINEKMNKWLGEKNAADTLSQSVPNNITSEMGLALLDVADAIRPYPEVINYLRHVNAENFLDELINLEGGQIAQDAITAYLKKYGMRCAGEIDITRSRWSEKPTTLIPIILGNIKNFEPNASQQKFEQGRKEAFRKDEDLEPRRLRGCHEAVPRYIRRGCPRYLRAGRGERGSRRFSFRLRTAVHGRGGADPREGEAEGPALREGRQHVFYGHVCDPADPAVRRREPGRPRGGGPRGLVGALRRTGYEADVVPGHLRCIQHEIPRIPLKERT